MGVCIVGDVNLHRVLVALRVCWGLVIAMMCAVLFDNNCHDTDIVWTGWGMQHVSVCSLCVVNNERVWCVCDVLWGCVCKHYCCCWICVWRERNGAEVC